MTKKIGPLHVWQWLALVAAAWYFFVGRKKTGSGRFRSSYTRARSYAGRGFGYARRGYTRARRYAGRTYRRTAGRYTQRGRTVFKRASAWSTRRFDRRY